MHGVQQSATTMELHRKLRTIVKSEFQCVKMKTAGLWMIMLAPDQIMCDAPLRSAEASIDDTLAATGR